MQNKIRYYWIISISILAILTWFFAIKVAPIEYRDIAFYVHIIIYFIMVLSGLIIGGNFVYSERKFWKSLIFPIIPLITSLVVAGWFTLTVSFATSWGLVEGLELYGAAGAFLIAIIINIVIFLLGNKTSETNSL